MTDLLIKAALAAAVAAGLWLGVINPYNNWVSVPRIEKALEAERAVEAPKLQAALDDAASAKSTIAAMNRKASGEKDKRTKEANERTAKYDAVVALNKKLFADFNAALLSKSELNDRLRNIESQYSDSAINTSDSGFTKRLGAAYAQCEQDVTALLNTASEQNERAAKAEAGLAALTLAK